MSLRHQIDSLITKFEKSARTLNRIEIVGKNILHNYDTFKKLNPRVEFWPVLKSNAYGHGLHQIAQILEARKFSYLVVDSYFEALKIREVTSRPLLLMGYTHPDNYKIINFTGLAFVVYDAASIKTIGATNRNTKIHLKINTGMNRQGINLNEIGWYLKLIRRYKNLELEGICSHLADADGENDDYTKFQEKNFDEGLQVIHDAGFNPHFIHLSNTAGTVKTKNKNYNAVRLGIGTYGFGAKNLKPALRFVTTLIKINEINAGDKVGYNCTFTAKRKMKIATVPVGYYEGADRRLSNCGFLKHKNHFLPIVGRTCMNISMVDISKTNLKVGDEVEFISVNSKDKNSVENIAKICQTIPYEILVKLNESVRRIVVRDVDLCI